MTKNVLLVGFALTMVACGDDDSPVGLDASVDAPGVDGATDSGQADGAPVDGGPGFDGGPGSDSGPRPDVGPAAEGRIGFRLVADRGAPSEHIAAVPFPPGVLPDISRLRLLDRDDEEVATAATVLATWPRDGSVRSVLLGFEFELARGEDMAFVVEFGTMAPSTPGGDATFIENQQSVAIIGSEWLVRSRVSGLLASEAQNSRFSTFDDEVSRYLESMSPPFEDYGVSCRGTSAHRTYYDSPHTTWVYYQRAADAVRFRRAQAESEWYRANELDWYDGRTMAVQTCQDSGWTPEDKLDWGVMRRMTGQGMLDDYLLTGNPAAREAVMAMGEAFVRSIPTLLGGRENTFRVTERNLAWPLMGVAAYYAIRPESEVRAALDALLGEAVEWQAAGSSGAFEHDIVRPDPEECSDGPAGGSPFMTSLLVDGLMDAHLLVDDARIATVVVGAATWLRDDAVTPDGQGFRYLWGCRSNGYEDTSPELNNLIVHVFGAAAWVSGDDAWLDAGDVFADAGLSSLYAGRPKQWNQTVRGFSRYLGYRGEMRAP